MVAHKVVTTPSSGFVASAAASLSSVQPVAITQKKILL